MFEQPRFVINLHGIGHPDRKYEPGEEVYWLSLMEFENLLDHVTTWQCAKDILFTFDDGNVSDYWIAAPRLRARSMRAIFFILAGKIGEQGYLSECQLQQLSCDGFEIGSHGLNHIAWTTLSISALRRELETSKTILEAATGHSIKSLSIPFGAYNGNIIRELKQHHYRNVFSSDRGLRLTKGIPTPRLTVKKGQDIKTLHRVVQAANGFGNRVITETRVRLKQIIR